MHLRTALLVGFVGGCAPAPRSGLPGREAPVEVGHRPEPTPPEPTPSMTPGTVAPPGDGKARSEDLEDVAITWVGGDGARAGSSAGGVQDVNGDGLDDFASGSYYEGVSLVLGKDDPDRIGVAVPDARILQAAGEESEVVVAPAGDVDGDGFHDLVLGVPGSTAGGDRSGEIRLLLGTSSVDGLAWEGTRWLETGPEYGRAGESLAGLGDVNGDGYGDFMAQSSGERALVFLGAPTPEGVAAPLQVDDEREQDFYALVVSSAGDFDGDGLDDAIIGVPDAIEATGEAYLFLGTSQPSDRTLASADASFTGKNVGYYLAEYCCYGHGDGVGEVIAGGGDVNGDGLGDLLLSADTYAWTEDGPRVYLLLGRENPSSLVLSSAEATFTGPDPDLGTGLSAGIAGDLDGDGMDDLLIGSRLHADHGGRTSVFFGSTDIGGSSIDGAGRSIYSETAPRVLSTAGDPNHDGLADFLVGEPSAGGSTTEDPTGSVSLVLGVVVGGNPQAGQ